MRVPVRVRRFGRLEPDERARLDLSPGAVPEQGAILEVVATVAAPREPEEEGDFDEAGYLRRQGVHVVLKAGGFRVVGRRGGLGGVADSLRRGVSRSLETVPSGERRAVLAGVVLGEDEGLEADLRDSFRASGLYHLLAVSGQNVAYVIAGTILLVWTLGLPRRIGELAALATVTAYVLAVGWQPSVIRAGVAGGLASLAWLASRPRDRWYFLLVGAAVLLAWNPYSLLEPGFQLSFSAVAAIFVLVPRISRRLEGYPLPRLLAEAIAVSSACGLVTAPILWLHFGAIPVYAVVANALAAPVVAPLLGLALAAAALHPALPEAAAALVWLDAWLAGYLALCARLVGGLPYAQAGSPQALGFLAALARLRARVHAHAGPGHAESGRRGKPRPGPHGRLARRPGRAARPARGLADHGARRGPGRRHPPRGRGGRRPRRSGPARGRSRRPARRARRGRAHGARAHPPPARPHRRRGRGARAARRRCRPRPAHPRGERGPRGRDRSGPRAGGAGRRGSLRPELPGRFSAGADPLARWLWNAG